MSARPAHDAIRAVRVALAGRHLVWSGIRGEDGAALGCFPELIASFAITAPMRDELATNVALEDISGVRPDLDRADLDVDAGDPAQVFRECFYDVVSSPSVVVTYRPTDLTSGAAFSIPEVTLAGPLNQGHSQFEYKPWVETSLRNIGVIGLDWRYIADARKDDAKRLVAECPQILRTSRTSGGAGVRLVTAAEDIDLHWPRQSEAFVAVAPFLEDAVPVNFSGSVYSDGSVRLHPLSVQLIGIEECTERPFGYCGNDFGAAKDFDDGILDQVDRLGRVVGRWLHGHRYRGVFGVDALVHEGVVRFLEVNPRFQGSSMLSALIADEVEMPSLFVDHLAEWLGTAPGAVNWSIRDWTRCQPEISQLVIHKGSEPVSSPHRAPLTAPPFGGELSQIPGDIRVEPNAALGRVVVRRSITQTGFDLDWDLRSFALDLRACRERVLLPV